MRVSYLNSMSQISIEPSSNPDVLVIGAGAAGIAATRALVAADVSVTLVEARNRVGGRAWTNAAACPWPIDMGAGWLHSADRNPLVAVANSAGYEIDRTTPPWQRAMIDKGFSHHDQQEFRAAQDSFYERMERAAREPDDQAAVTLLESDNRWNAMIDAVSTYVNGVELDHLSVKDFDNYHDTEFNYRIERGYGSLFGTLADGLPLALDCAVRSIDHRGKTLSLDTTRGTMTARCVIVAAPTNILATEAIRFLPALPHKHNAAAHLPLGYDNKLFLSLDGAEEFEADSRIFGAHDRVATAGYHLRPFGRPMIEAYFGGRLARDLEHEGLPAFAHFATEQLCGVLGHDFRKRLKPIAVSGWASDPFSQGSYSHALPGHWDKRALLAAPVEQRLFFAGEACSAHQFSTVHGAWETGVQAAQDCLETLKKTARI